jgi:hypothetical protein
MRIGGASSSGYSRFSLHLLLFTRKCPSLVDVEDVVVDYIMLGILRLALLSLCRLIEGYSWRIGALLASKSLGGLLCCIQLQFRHKLFGSSAWASSLPTTMIRVGSLPMMSLVLVFSPVLNELLDFDHLFLPAIGSCTRIPLSLIGSLLLVIAVLDELFEIMCKAAMVLKPAYSGRCRLLQQRI